MPSQRAQMPNGGKRSIGTERAGPGGEEHTVATEDLSPARTPAHLCSTKLCHPWDDGVELRRCFNTLCSTQKREGRQKSPTSSIGVGNGSASNPKLATSRRRKCFAKTPRQRLRLLEEKLAQFLTCPHCIRRHNMRRWLPKPLLVGRRLRRDSRRGPPAGFIYSQDPVKLRVPLQHDARQRGRNQKGHPP